MTHVTIAAVDISPCRATQLHSFDGMITSITLMLRVCKYKSEIIIGLDQTDAIGIIHRDPDHNLAYSLLVKDNVSVAYASGGFGVMPDLGDRIWLTNVAHVAAHYPTKPANGEDTFR